MGAVRFFKDKLKRTRVIPQKAGYPAGSTRENRSRKNLLNGSEPEELTLRKRRLVDEGIRLGLKENLTNRDIARMRDIKSEIDSINYRLGKPII